MAETFKLPSSSYEELIKLFQAYANTKEGTALSLDDITQATGVPRTVVSKNNGFMVQVGLITEGNKKAATETGRALGRAYTSKITDEVDRIWKEIIAEVDFLNRMLSAVRIRNGMDRSSFINHIIYSSGLKDTKESRAGAGALIEIFKSVGVLLEVDGKLTVPDDSSCTKPSATSNSVPVEQLHPEIVAQQTHPATRRSEILKQLTPSFVVILPLIRSNCPNNRVAALRPPCPRAGNRRKRRLISKYPTPHTPTSGKTAQDIFPSRW